MDSSRAAGWQRQQAGQLAVLDLVAVDHSVACQNRDRLFRPK